MSRKKMTYQVLEEIEQQVQVESNETDLERLAVKISLRDMTQQEKIQDASRPLYLKRYE